MFSKDQLTAADSLGLPTCLRGKRVREPESPRELRERERERLRLRLRLRLRRRFRLTS